MRIMAGLILAGTFALSACGDDAAQVDQTVAQGGKAAGEVLGGTISDDMLPLDTLTSQSPPAKLSPEEGGPAIDESAGTGAEEGAGDEPAQPVEGSASQEEGAEGTAR